MSIRSDLFRPEAVKHRGQKLYGDVVLTMPRTRWPVTGLIGLAVALLVALLVFGSFARKETVSGRTRPDRGVVQVRVPDDGVVESIHVEEGRAVEAGAPLVTLKLDADLAQGGTVTQRLSAELHNERLQLERQYDATRARFDVSHLRLRDELANLEAEIAQYRRQVTVQDRRTALAQKQAEDQADLVKQGFVSKLEARRYEDMLLAQSQAAEALVQDRLAKENRLNTARYELAAISHEREAALGVIGARLAALDQRLTEVSRRSQVVLVAPVSGRIASVNVANGESAKAQAVVVELLPEGGKLQAELFVPSRAAGFLFAGADVQIRYDAFPYQKFGVSRGRVLRVSRTSLDPGELRAGAVGDDPAYRVIVELERDHVVIDGKAIPLRTGMTLKADVLLERRRMVEYLFAPLFGLARRR